MKGKEGGSGYEARERSAWMRRVRREKRREKKSKERGVVRASESRGR